MNDVRIAANGLQLRGKLLDPGEPAPEQPSALFLHGWGGTQRQDVGNAKRLVALGCTCVTFNLTGHGRTRAHIETVTRADNLRDALAAYDFLASRRDAGRDHVGVVGSSYGGYLAMLLTGERRVRWVALRVPALYRDDDFDRPKRELNLDGSLATYRHEALTPRDNRALGHAARFEGDVLIVESERDSLIPHQVIANYLAAFTRARSVTHRMIEGADHALSEERWRRAYGTMLSEWFAERVGASRGTAARRIASRQ